MVNNYDARTFRNLRLTDELASPTIYFANLLVCEEKHRWENKEELIQTARKTIRTTIEQNSFLNDINRGKFIIAFPFGYCIYTWGNKNEIDAEPIKEYEFEFTNEFASAKQIPPVNPCMLENRIKVAEGEIWRDSKTIKQYYEHPRGNVSWKHYYPDKKFE